MKNASAILLYLLCLSIVPSFAQQQSDGEAFAEGRMALDQYKDCARARQIFESESAAAKQYPSWLDYAARSAECAGDIRAALGYYEGELSKLPGTPRLLNKVGELRYKVRLLQEQDDQRQAANSAEIERQRVLARDEAARVSEAKGHQAELFAKLAQRLTTNSKWRSYRSDGSGDYFMVELKRQVKPIVGCVLTYHEDEKAGGYWTHKDNSVNLSGLSAIDTSPGYENAQAIYVRSNYLPGGPTTEFTLYLSIDTDEKELIQLFNDAGRSCMP